MPVFKRFIAVIGAEKAFSTLVIPNRQFVFGPPFNIAVCVPRVFTREFMEEIEANMARDAELRESGKQFASAEIGQRPISLRSIPVTLEAQRRNSFGKFRSISHSDEFAWYTQ